MDMCTDLFVQHVTGFLCQAVPLAPELPDQTLGVGRNEVDHVTEGWDLPRAVEDVVLDQRVQLPLVEVRLELGTRPELVKIEQHQVWIESRFTVWWRPAKLGLWIKPLPAAEGLHVSLGLLRRHCDGLLPALHLLDDVVQVADVVL